MLYDKAIVYILISIPKRLYFSSLPTLNSSPSLFIYSLGSNFDVVVICKFSKLISSLNGLFSIKHLYNLFTNFTSS